MENLCCSCKLTLRTARHHPAAPPRPCNSTGLNERVAGARLGAPSSSPLPALPLSPLCSALLTPAISPPSLPLPSLPPSLPLPHLPALPSAPACLSTLPLLSPPALPEGNTCTPDTTLAACASNLTSPLSIPPDTPSRSCLLAYATLPCAARAVTAGTVRQQAARSATPSMPEQQRQLSRLSARHPDVH